MWTPDSSLFSRDTCHALHWIFCLHVGGTLKVFPADLLVLETQPCRLGVRVTACGKHHSWELRAWVYTCTYFCFYKSFSLCPKKWENWTNKIPRPKWRSTDWSLIVISKSGLWKIMFPNAWAIYWRHVISLQSAFIYQVMDDCAGLVIFLLVILTLYC